jgi:cell division septation protein DedD
VKVPPKAVATAAPATKPEPKHAAAPASGNWRIQLGAFSQRGNAEALYKKVSGKASLAGRQPYYVAAGAVTRLQVGPFESKAAAESACRAVGVPCFPVPAK